MLGGVDTSTRGALGVVRGKLAGGSSTADATRSARVVLFLVKQYAGLAAILGAPPPDARTAAFASTLCAVHQILETAPPSEARAGARAALGSELDGACLRVCVAHGAPFISCLAGPTTNEAGRGACLSRLMEAHGAAVADLFEGGEPAAGVVLRAAIAGALAAPRPDFARLVEGPVVALRLAMRQDARDAVDALIKAAAAEDARARARARRFDLGGVPRGLRAAAAPGAAGAAPGERRGRRRRRARGARGLGPGPGQTLRRPCEPARRWRPGILRTDFLARGRSTHTGCVGARQEA